MADQEIDPRWGTPSLMHDPAFLARFVARPTDVVVNTASKAGTTWMQQILYQLASGGDAAFVSINEVVPWLEAPGKRLTTEQRLQAYAAKPDPRLFKAHLSRQRTPGAEVAKFVIVARDPRDCCVSHYHHLHGMTPELLAWLSYQPPHPFEVYFERWLVGTDWFDHMTSWWPHRGDANVLWLRFGDLKRDLAGAIDRIAAFTGWTVSEAARARALEHSSFAWMSAHHDKFTRLFDGEPPSFADGSFIRKGAVGEHALTPELEARLLAKAREVLEPDCLRDLGLA